MRREILLYVAFVLLIGLSISSNFYIFNTPILSGDEMGVFHTLGLLNIVIVLMLFFVSVLIFKELSPKPPKEKK